MYNFKKVFRKKSNIFLIILLSILFLCLLFLFKYVFVVNVTIEHNIYDRHRNRELLVYDDKDKVLNVVENIDEVLFVYDDYQMLQIENEDIGSLSISLSTIEHMPKLIAGVYPKDENEIIIPRYNYLQSGKIDLLNLVNKEIELILNNENTIKMKISGIYDNINDFSAYYNLSNVEFLINNTLYNKTGNTRILIDHFKNKDYVINSLPFKADLYDMSGLDEITLYQSLYDLVIMLIVIVVIFIMVILLIVSSIVYLDTKDDRFILYVLGLNNRCLVKNYVIYYLYILLISMLVSIMGYIGCVLFYNYFVSSSNLIINELFNYSMNIFFIIPVFVIIIVMTFVLSIIITIRFSRVKQIKN